MRALAVVALGRVPGAVGGKGRAVRSHPVRGELARDHLLDRLVGERLVEQEGGVHVGVLRVGGGGEGAHGDHRLQLEVHLVQVVAGRGAQGLDARHGLVDAREEVGEGGGGLGIVAQVDVEEVRERGKARAGLLDVEGGLHRVVQVLGRAALVLELRTKRLLHGKPELASSLLQALLILLLSAVLRISDHSGVLGLGLLDRALGIAPEALAGQPGLDLALPPAPVEAGEDGAAI